MNEREYVTLDELEEKTGIPKGTLYHKTRFNELAGQFRVGRKIYVHWPTFESSLREKMVAA